MVKIYGNELFHYGTKGQKWGIRRYQNEDGSYTASAKAENNGLGRYAKVSVKGNRAFHSRDKRIIDKKVKVEVKKPEAGASGGGSSNDQEYANELADKLIKEIEEWAKKQKDNPMFEKDLSKLLEDESIDFYLEEYLDMDSSKVSSSVKSAVESKLKSHFSSSVSHSITVYGNELYHWGVLGMKWGVRRYQNEDGTLTTLGRQRLLKKDAKWAKKNYKKIYKETYKKSRKELNDYVENDLNQRVPIYNANNKISLTYANEFNKKLAEIMTKNASEITAPSGNAIKFIAKRGEIGAHMIVSEQNFDERILKNGVYSSGKIAYKKQNVNME